MQQSFFVFFGVAFYFFFSYFFYLIMLLQISSPCYMSSWSWSSQVCDNFIWLDYFVDRLLYSKLLIFIQEQIRLFLFREESDALEAIYMRGYKFQIQKNSVLNCLFKHPFVQTSKAKVQKKKKKRKPKIIILFCQKFAGYIYFAFSRIASVSLFELQSEKKKKKKRPTERLHEKYLIEWLHEWLH